MSLSPLVISLLASLAESFVVKFASAMCAVSATKSRRKAGPKQHIAPILFGFLALKSTFCCVFLRRGDEAVAEERACGKEVCAEVWRCR
jgi:hypothetical protein